MPHPLIIQLRFARSEFKRALDGLSDSDARHRFLPSALDIVALEQHVMPRRDQDRRETIVRHGAAGEHARRERRADT